MERAGTAGGRRPPNKFIRTVAEFSHYFDSGVLVKIYHLEPGSPEASKRIKRAGCLPLPFLTEMEIRNALRVLHGRKQLSKVQLEAAQALIDSDIRGGRLARIAPEPAKVAATAENLSRSFSAATLCRTLDLLHVSLAVVLEVSHFHTGDRRQAALARKAGLRVSFLGKTS
jgi:predicted nucleic acid-binding protein